MISVCMAVAQIGATAAIGLVGALFLLLLLTKAPRTTGLPPRKSDVRDVSLTGHARAGPAALQVFLR